jgi:hypothetical protein
MNAESPPERASTRKAEQGVGSMREPRHKAAAS